MVKTALRALGEALVRLYYPDRAVVGRERLPAGGPAIFVLNHPNGLLDPLLLRVLVGRPIGFLAKSTLFANPLGRLAMEAFASIPVHRAQDVGPGATTAGDRAAANEATFARCRARLADGQAIALFPEGVSHSDPQMRPLKTGAARIALGFADEHPSAPLTLVPVGLFYEQKATFRSRVLAVVGKPLAVADRLDEYRRDGRAAVERLTDDLRAALDEVVVQAETRDLLEGVARVAVWAAPAPAAAEDPGEQHSRSRALVAAYGRLRERDPEGVERIVRAARDYARILRRLGVRDPWALEYQPVRLSRALRAVATLLLAAPAAALGALLGWAPYRLAGRVAGRVTREEDVLGTVKLLAGALFLVAGWTLGAVAAGVAAGPLWAAAALAAGPTCGYVALRYDEIVSGMRESLRHLYLRGAHFRQVQRLAERRRALAAAVADALDRASP